MSKLSSFFNHQFSFLLPFRRVQSYTAARHAFKRLTSIMLELH